MVALIQHDLCPVVSSDGGRGTGASKWRNFAISETVYLSLSLSLSIKEESLSLIDVS